MVPTFLIKSKLLYIAVKIFILIVLCAVFALDYAV